MSLEAWISPGALPVVGQFASVVSKAEGYSLQFNGPALEFTVIQGGVRYRLAAPSGSVSVGRTWHVVGTLGAGVAKLYVNGSLVASAARSGAPSVVTSPLVIGSWDGSSEFFTGTIDEVALYPTALSATQVSAHRATGTGGTTTATAPSYAVTTSVSGTGTGTITSRPTGLSCPSTCSGAFPSGTAVTLTATPASGSTFVGWTGACTGAALTCTFSTYAATSAGASFGLPTESYPLSVTRGGRGAGNVGSSPAGISCGATCTASYAAGTAVTLTAQPVAGSVFTGWAGSCAGTATCSVTMSAARAVSATFQPDTTYALALTVGGEGGVTSAPAGVDCLTSCSRDFPAGTAVTLTATPTVGRSFGGWSGACVGTGSCVVRMDAAVGVTATFR